MKKMGFLYILILGLFFIPKSVFAQSYNRTASVGRSAVMNTSSTYYYTDWTLLSTNSLNSVPVPYSGGDYYQMGSEYSFPITMNGDTYFTGNVKIPVVSNTIYNYQLMNGLNQYDMKFGVHQNWGVYNVNAIINSSTWECQTYSHLGIAHNYCYYNINFSFSLTEALSGAYNLNVGVIDFTGNRSSYYYSGYDSNGNAIEFPVSSQNSGYPTISPYLSMSSTGGSSGSDNTEEILGGIEDATDAITDQIQESYENLVKSQEVCTSSSLGISNTSISSNNQYLTSSGAIGSSSNWNISSYYPIEENQNIRLSITTTNAGVAICFYDSSNTLISCNGYTSSNLSLTAPTGSSYFRFSQGQRSTHEVLVFFLNCKNGNQAISDNIMDETIDSFIGQGQLSDIGGSMTTDTPITDLLAMPIKLLSSIYTGITGTCSDFNLGTLWGVGLTLSCVNPELYLGSTLWGAIDLLFCGFMIFNIAQLMIHDFESLSSAEDLFDETYTPRHEKLRRSK